MSWSCVTEGRSWMALTAGKRYNKCHILEIKITYWKIIRVPCISIKGFHASTFMLMCKGTMVSKYQFTQSHFHNARKMVGEIKFPQFAAIVKISQTLHDRLCPIAPLRKTMDEYIRIHAENLPIRKDMKKRNLHSYWAKQSISCTKCGIQLRRGYIRWDNQWLTTHHLGLYTQLFQRQLSIPFWNFAIYAKYISTKNEITAVKTIIVCIKKQPLLSCGEHFKCNYWTLSCKWIE